MLLAPRQKEGSDMLKDSAVLCRCAEVSVPSRSHKSKVHFLAVLVLMHVLLSVGGFVYLIHTYNAEKQGAGKSFAASEKEETSHKTLAQMVPERPSVQLSQRSSSGHLQWDMIHSICRNVNYDQRSWLTVLQPGDYYVFSRVTFSKAHSKSPLASIVKLKKSKAAEEKVVMLAYCSLVSHGSAPTAPRMCTATQGEVMVLEKGDQLSVWVEDVSLVDYSEGATAFGMYKL